MELHKPIGILGGTFDPIHNGHIELALQILQQTPVETIKLLPCFQPVHKERLYASAIDRVAMIEIAIRSYPDLQLDRTEIERGGASYMIDTLTSLSMRLPLTPLCLILGQDAFSRFSSWKRWIDLFSLAHIIVANRPDSHPVYPSELAAQVEQRRIDDPQLLTKQLAGSILWVDIPPIAISATKIRSRIHTRQSIEDLVPQDIDTYIYEHHLYY